LWTVPVFLVLLVTMIWAGFFLLVKDPAWILAESQLDLERAYPEPAERASLVRRSAGASSWLIRQIPGGGGGSSPVIRAAFAVSALHSFILGRVLPLSLLLLTAGVGSGLILRERMRDAEGYASPSAAGIARVLVGAGTLTQGLYALSPIGLSSSWLYVAGVTCSLGAALYAANLPLRL
jgi:hypothetical protein